MKILLPSQSAPLKESDTAESFRRFAHQASKIAGSPRAFAIGIFAVVLWGLSGHLFDYSENWQLVINTGTTIITFLMVFLIQNTQARDSKELHLKLDELLRAGENARNLIIKCEEFSDEELERIEKEIRQSVEESRML